MTSLKEVPGAACPSGAIVETIQVPPARGPSLSPPPGAVFLTVAQVCERMQLSRPSVIALIKSRQLSAIKVGRHWRISAASFDRLAGGDE